MRHTNYILTSMLFVLISMPVFSQVDPDTAMKANIDRFSMEAGTLFVRDSVNGLPGPNEPVNFDEGPFITMGLGPQGEFISYYNFDVQPTEPAPIYVLFREGEIDPVEDQLNIVGVVPGDAGYNDFWRVNFVTVPQNYVANTITKVSEIIGSHPVTETDILVNCPIVPEGSTAELRYNKSEDPGLTRGWYETMVVFYFNFSERALMVNSSGMVPLSPIYVTFNINPGEPGGGPPSGFMVDSTGRTHNVTATLPEDAAYSPLWSVNIYDNNDFDMVMDLQSALMASILVMGAANVNCPVVLNESASSVEPYDTSLPKDYVLNQNFPNPFNPSTTIRFSILSNEFVTLKIFNIIGEEIAVLVNEILTSGSYSVNWNAENITSGIYFYTLATNQFRDTKKMILIR
ncbi:MAG: T9SS type A sorting domain-containing protein [Ignavibacteriaceae bacterium]|nr:T9SS type A sorting domain-containing protein [Ignavibacteriaceae bacterium]